MSVHILFLRARGACLDHSVGHHNLLLWSHNNEPRHNDGSHCGCCASGSAATEKSQQALENSENITEPALKSRVPSLCCMKSDQPIDEGEALPSPMSSTTNAMQPDNTQGSDELIVGNAAPLQLPAVEWNGTDITRKKHTGGGVWS